MSFPNHTGPARSARSHALLAAAFTLALPTLGLAKSQGQAPRGDVPPAYTATVLPQLDAGDEFSLTATEGRALNDQRMVTGSLANTGLGFTWSSASGGELLQPRFSDVAEQAGGYGINNAGDLVGALVPHDAFLGQTHPFVLEADGTFHSLPTLLTELSAGASDINDSGMIVGTAQRSTDGSNSAVYWLDGDIHELPDLGGPANNAFAVNNQGVVVGTTNEDWGSPWIAFRWSETDGLEPLAGLVDEVPAEAIDINDQNIVIGRGGVSLGQNRPVYWDQEGELHQLPCLYETPQCIATGINNDNIIVGHELNTAEPFPESEARVWINDQVYHLQELVGNLPGNLELLEAVDINSSGEIIVTASVTDADTPEWVTVLLSPQGTGVPEARPVPALDLWSLMFLAVAVAGLAGLPAAARRLNS